MVKVALRDWVSPNAFSMFMNDKSFSIDWLEKGGMMDS